MHTRTHAYKHSCIHGYIYAYMNPWSYIYIYRHACADAGIRAYIHACKHTCIHAFTHICLHTFLRDASICIRTHTHIYVIFIFEYPYLCIYPCIILCIYLCIYICIYLCTYLFDSIYCLFILSRALFDLSCFAVVHSSRTCCTAATEPANETREDEWTVSWLHWKRWLKYVKILPSCSVAIVSDWFCQYWVTTRLTRPWTNLRSWPLACHFVRAIHLRRPNWVLGLRCLGLGCACARIRNTYVWRENHRCAGRTMYLLQFHKLFGHPRSHPVLLGWLFPPILFVTCLKYNMSIVGAWSK
jgi:hypothetical protein